MSTYRSSYLGGSSEKAEDLCRLLHSDYDFAILSSSWDQRCLAICECDLRVDVLLLLHPPQRDELGLRDSHDSLLTEFTKKSASTVLNHTIDDTFPEEAWIQIYDRIREAHSKKTSPRNGRALVDLSVSCRFLSLGLIAMLLRLGICKEIDVVYSECEYLFDEGAIGFTEGIWQKRIIPFLSGDTNPAFPERSFVSIGFEGLKTQRFLKSDEPDQIYLILPYPGFNREYESRSEKQAALLQKEFNIPDQYLIRSEAADAIAVWKQIAELSESLTDNMQDAYICSGTKPHSLGMAIHALVARKPAVYYISADSQQIVPTRKTGMSWRYRIRDYSQI
jgi:hypothetical protein